MTKLTDLAVQALKPGEQVTDAAVAGLLVEGTADGAKWMYRYSSPEVKFGPGHKKAGEYKRRTMGLGVYPRVSLAEARRRALDARELIDAGKDPLEQREREKRAAEEDSKVPTFGQAAKSVHADLKAGWKATKNVAQWIANVEQYLAPILGRRVDVLTPRDFANALRAEWVAHPRSAADALQRASQIMAWCFAHGYAASDPTSLVRSLLPRQTARTEHHPSLDWRDAPAFVSLHLSNIEPQEVVRAAAFVSLHTACRPGEVRAMRRGELDLDNALWTVPAERMKGKVAHVVPLAPDVVTLLRRMLVLPLHDELIFPNVKGTGPVSDVRLQEFMQKTGAKSDTPERAPTPHGNRATFKNFSVDHGFDERTAERQLAHRPKGQTTQAYERTTQFERRRQLVERWADYLHGRWTSDIAGNVIELSRKNAAA